MSSRAGVAVGVLLLAGFAVTLAVLIVNRLSDQQVAVLTGAVCGAGLALPLGLALGAYAAASRPARRPEPPAPPIIYMASPPAPITPVSPPRSIELGDYPAPTRRSFNVIGDSGFDDE
jgi:hypothetical protein